MKKSLVFLVGLMFFIGTGTAFAIPMGTGLQDVLDNITVGDDSNVNVTTDMIADNSDSYWGISGSGGSIATMIIEIAGFAPNNKFGVYNNDNYVELFGGPDTAGAQKSLSIMLDGSVFVNFEDTGVNFTGNNFGYYLDSSYYKAGGLFHSDTALNVDGRDHMLAYQGKGDQQIQIAGFAPGTWSTNEYILAFEDLLIKPDWDFTDMVVIVESVSPVPEPGTLILLGSGLAGLALYRRRSMNK